MREQQGPLEASIKSPGRSAVDDTAPVQVLVAEILAAVAAEGDAAVARFAAKFDKSALERFEVSDGERADAVAALDGATRAGHRVRHRQRASVRRGAARDHPAARGRDPARRAPRPPGDPDRARRLLRAGRPLSAAVGADHDDRAGQGRRRRRGHRLPAAQRAPGDDRRLPPVGRRPHLPDRRRAGDRRDGLRHRERARGRQDRRAGQRLRQRGQAAGVRARSASTSWPGRRRSSSSPTRPATPR